MKEILFFLLLSSFYCIKYEEYNETDVNLEELIDLKSSRCLPTERETKEFFQKNGISYDDKIDNNVKFIAGDCSPIILVPGIYSTKLKVQLNCKNIKRDESLMYEKIKFYCGDRVCSKITDENENRDLWFNIAGDGFDLFKTPFENNEKYFFNNKHSACLGFFMTIFNNEDECPKLDESKRICEHSKNIKISYEGGFYDSISKSKCGLAAIENVLLLHTFNVNLEKSTVFGKLVETLTQYGYQPGFSLAGVPNDFRQFISTNTFANKTLNHLINTMYENTGKRVIIIAHSFGNLVTLNTLKQNSELKTKIKKWISLAPPFGGATKAVDNFLHGITDFNFDILKYGRSEFSEFGQFLMLKSIPTVYELRPNPIFWKIFNDENYKDFATAIRDRLELEKNCKKNNKCDPQEIIDKSKNFDEIFADYFPSLNLKSCEYEPSVPGNNKALNKKCFTEIFNLVDYPSFIKVNSDSSFNIDDYYQKKGEDFYYIADCDQLKDSKCLDNIFPEVKCVFDSYTSDLNDLIGHYEKTFNVKKTREDFPSPDEYRKIINEMISYHNKTNKIKELENPEVDIDLVYSSFNPTLAAEFVHKDYLTQKANSTKGGDGTVPTWSSLLTGLKWIYDKKKNNLNQNIRLVEYCSRLANSDINLKYFKPISCKCLEGNAYKDDLDSCSHQFMLLDEILFNYIEDEIVKDEKNIASIKTALDTYSKSDKKHLSKCNLQLFNFINKDGKIPCSDDIEITKEEFDKGKFCKNKGYAKMPGRECCSVHISGKTYEKQKFDVYYCDNIKIDSKEIDRYIEEVKVQRNFFYDEEVEVNVDCYSCNLLSRKILLLLYLILLIKKY